MVRVHQEIQDAIQRIDPVAEYQYYAQSHRYITSTTLNPTDVLPVLHTQYQYYTQSYRYITSTTQFHRFITSTTHTVPVLHPQYLIPQLSVLHSIPQVYYQYYTQFQH